MRGDGLSFGAAFAAKSEKFFMGRLYPPLIGCLVVFGYCFGIEMYLGALNILLASLALCVCKSARPILLFIMSFVFQVSIKNSPAIPNMSDYFFTSWRIVAIFILGAVLLASVVVFSVRNKIFSGIHILKTPLLLSLCILTVAFCTNGIFSGRWQVGSLVYGLCCGAILSLVYVFFYFGLRRENKRELISYFVYVSAILALMLIIELAVCYVVNDIVFDPFKLEINLFEKEKLLFGWGISNTMGVSLIVLIPACMLGFYEKWGRFIYVPLAFLVYLAIFATMSRNAILFGTLTLLLSVLVLLFASKRRKIYAVIVSVLAIVGIVFAIIYREPIWDKLTEYFTDNGRFNLWKKGYENFKESPIFGVGFFGVGIEVFETAEFLPTMVHQTFVQLMSAMGLFGLLAYLFYRGSTLLPVFRRPSAAKALIALSWGAMLFESLVDNFIFYFLPTLHYSIALAVMFVICDAERENNDTND